MDDKEVTAEELKAKLEAFINQLYADLKPFQAQIFLAAAGLLLAVSLGYWLGRRN